MLEKGIIMKLIKVRLSALLFNQLEVFVNAQWKVVIRYDSAHEFAHIDRYYLDGKKVKKELRLKLDEALTLADEDIKENWKISQKAFLEGK